MTESPLDTAYRIETDRLLIRCWSPADAPVLRAALDESDQHLRPWIPWMKDEPKSLDETAAGLRIKRATTIWARISGMPFSTARSKR